MTMMKMKEFLKYMMQENQIVKSYLNIMRMTCYVQLMYMLRII